MLIAIAFLLKFLFWLFVACWIFVMIFKKDAEGELKRTLTVFLGIIVIIFLIVNDLLIPIFTDRPLFPFISSIISLIFFIIIAIACGLMAFIFFQMGRDYYKNLTDNEVVKNYANKNDTPKEKNLEIKSILSFVASIILAYICWVCLKNAFL